MKDFKEFFSVMQEFKKSKEQRSIEIKASRDITNSNINFNVGPISPIKSRLKLWLKSFQFLK